MSSLTTGFVAHRTRQSGPRLLENFSVNKPGYELKERLRSRKLNDWLSVDFELAYSVLLHIVPDEVRQSERAAFSHGDITFHSLYCV
jgi:hypothetical protein